MLTPMLRTCSCAGFAFAKAALYRGPSQAKPQTNVSKKHISNANKRANMDWTQAVKDLDENQVKFYHSEQLIKVDESDAVVGCISKGEAHAIETIRKGIYHRALSLLIFDSSDRFLLTQRAATKITFPNYFTNACCSHPLHNELELEDDGTAIGVRRAVVRRSNFELGTKLDSFAPGELKLMNKLCYRAESDGGVWGEAEVDYIFILHKDVELDLNADEVSSFRYVDRQEMKHLIDNPAESGVKVTPWVRLLARDYLFSYWDNLRRLDEIAEPHKIVRYSEIFPST